MVKTRARGTKVKVRTWRRVQRTKEAKRTTKAKGTLHEHFDDDEILMEHAYEILQALESDGCASGNGQFLAISWCHSQYGLGV